jgi:hypothetical protein
MIQLSGMSRGVVDAASAAAYQRTFWVIYILEKTLSFACGRPSVWSSPSHHISTVVLTEKPGLE